jgi:hypothetical protein
MSILEMPASKYESVMNNWPKVFKLWVQGDTVSNLLNMEEKNLSYESQRRKTVLRGFFVPKTIVAAAHLLDSPSFQRAAHQVSHVRDRFGSWAGFLKSLITIWGDTGAGHISLGCFLGHAQDGSIIEQIIVHRFFCQGSKQKISSLGYLVLGFVVVMMPLKVFFER